MVYLFVVAHPDDEVLGAGAMIYELSKKGHDVHVVVMNAIDTTRYEADLNQLKVDLETSNKIIGTKSINTLGYEDSEFHRASHRKMVQDIERWIKFFEPDFIFTHHPGDVNTDHHWTSYSCQEAARMFQRGRGYSHRLRGLFFMEVQSSTDWRLNPCADPFTLNYFVKISQEGLDRKIEALMVYENVVRPHPHPRSIESLKALPVLRGSQSGFMLAEAFQAVFMTTELK